MLVKILLDKNIFIYFWIKDESLLDKNIFIYFWIKDESLLDERCKIQYFWMKLFYIIL